LNIIIFTLSSICVILTYMIKNLFTILFILLSIVIGACSSTAGKTADNSKTGLNWVGVYAGVIPSAEGSGINVQITLRAGQGYTIVYNYVDKPGIFTESGTFNWDKVGKVITLNNTTFPPYYRVSENYLLQLDMNGKKITGNLADQYVLKKKS